MVTEARHAGNRRPRGCVDACTAGVIPRAASGGGAIWSKRETVNRIWLTRQALGLEPKQIAERLGIGLNTYSQWESGKTPDWANLVNYAERLDVSLDWILRGKISSLRHELAQRVIERQQELGDVDTARLALRKVGRPPSRKTKG
jgi:transcriptional regulator with XRE-family HTH domain